MPATCCNLHRHRPNNLAFDFNWHSHSQAGVVLTVQITCSWRCACHQLASPFGYPRVCNSSWNMMMGWCSHCNQRPRSPGCTRFLLGLSFILDNSASLAAKPMVSAPCKNGEGSRGMSGDRTDRPAQSDSRLSNALIAGAGVWKATAMHDEREVQQRTMQS